MEPKQYDRSVREELIAPGKSKADWAELLGRLVCGGDEVLWAEAFETFLLARLQSRYLHPIEVLRTLSKWEGEGFAIVSIQCALIEFLAALREGKTFRYKDPKLPYEYNRSGTLVRDFLCGTEPFAELFNEVQASDFYDNVRCALLHEARTKAGWIIWASGEPAVDAERKIVFRDSLQDLIKRYITDFGNSLIKDVELQQAFIRKFNDLAN